MTSLANLPNEIKAAQVDLSNAKATLAKAEDEMKYIEKTAPTNGSNADERKANLARYLASSARYQVLQRDQANAESAISRLTIDEKHYTNQFAAVGFQARLHAGLMAYLAASGAVMPEFNFTPVYTKNGNGFNHGDEMTEVDAAELGL